MSGLCEEMKSRGVNLDWYDKRKHRPTATGPVPLDDAICSRNSIYDQARRITVDGEVGCAVLVECDQGATRARAGGH
jgi:hypothetical protein